MTRLDPSPASRDADPAAEYHAATRRAALFDVSDRTELVVTGRDRAAFLHNFCTNDVKRLQPGEGCEAFVTSAKGRILSHILVFAEENSLWIDSDPGTQSALCDHLNRYVVTEDVEIADRTGERRAAFVCGPDSANALRKVLAVELDGTAMCAGARSARYSGGRIRRVPFAAVPGFLIAVAPAEFPALCERLHREGVDPAGPAVFEALRIEAVYPRYGIDISEEHLAQEAGRTPQAISFTKGCYLGQEPIARLDALGHTNRELRGLRFEESCMVPRLSPVFDATGAVQVGAVSSIALSYAADCRPVALAMLRTSAAAPGTRVQVRGVDGVNLPAVVFGPPSAV